jgi:hypothetical protein
VFRNGADGRISNLAVRYIKTKTFAQQYASLDAHFLVIGFTPASISGPPVYVLLCAPLTTTSSPARPIRRVPAVVQASYFLYVVSTRPLSFRSLSTGCYPCSPLSNPRVRSPRSARYLKPALRPLPLLCSLAGLIVISCASLHSVSLAATPLYSCDWSKLAWIIVVVSPYTSSLLYRVATLMRAPHT